MTLEIYIKNVPDDTTPEEIEEIIEQLKEPAKRYYGFKEGSGIDWIENDIQVCLRKIED